MKDALTMRLFSRKPLSEAQSKKQIVALSQFAEGAFCPEKWGAFEPIRTTFRPDDLSGPVHSLSNDGGLFLYRRRTPKSLDGSIWNLENSSHSSVNSVKFQNYWISDFKNPWLKASGPGMVEAFVAEMFEVSEADFGLLTTPEDLDAKNYLVELIDGGRTMRYAGLDPSIGIPGLYWMNFFSPWLADWLNIDRLSNQIGIIRQHSPKCTILQFGGAPADCRSFETLGRQRAAQELLGLNRFFDIGQPNRQLEFPIWPEDALTIDQNQSEDLSHFAVTVEGTPEEPLQNLAALDAAIGRLTTVGGPGFVILSHDEGDYVQVAGGRRGLTVEWREYAGHSFRHLVAGDPKVPSMGITKIRTSGQHLTVNKNERLGSLDAKEILTAFATKAGRPMRFSWRDISPRFK